LVILPNINFVPVVEKQKEEKQHVC